MPDLLKLTAERAAHYLGTLDQRSVAPSLEAIERLSELGGALPDGATDPVDVLKLLDEVGSPATVASAGGRYFGFVVGGALPATVAANWLAGAWDQCAALVALSPVGAAIEEIALRWLLDVLGLPTDCAGGFVSGTTAGHLMGLAAARHAVLANVGWDVEAQGLVGAPPITVVVGEEVHVSVHKALSLLGLGRDRVVTVPADNQGRMRADMLPALTGPTIVCLQAGNVNTGAFDPAVEICAQAHAAGAWVHVDGAFGLWAAAAPARAHLAAGLAEADSWATDAHKWLNVPYDCGLVFTHHPQALRAAGSLGAAYLGTAEQREPFHYTAGLARRARGVEVWAALRSLGRSGVADVIERTCRHAQRFAMGLAAAGYAILNEVVLNQVLVSFGEAAVTERIIEELQAEGTCWCGGTVWQGQTAMRISVSSWATTEADVEQSLAAMLRLAARHRPQGGQR